MDRMVEAVADVGKTEANPKMEGRNLNLILVPK
jgi:translation initiation factor IF-3